MIAEELINHMVPPLKLTDSAEKALAWMEELRCNHLPVVESGKFLGLISEEIILEQNNIEKQVSSFELEALECIINKEQHFYDVVKVSSAFNVLIVAVVNDDNEYLGVITVQDTITSFAQTAAIQAPGAIIVLSMEARDYALSEICRLIESENAKVLGSTISEDPLDPQKIKLTLKINKTDLSHVAATLERFGYKIIARFQEPKILDNSQERLDILMRYLNI